MTRLQIFIDRCAASRRAVDLATLVHHRIPAVSIEVVDLAGEDVQPPDLVFAVPTYLVDGQLFSLGNPNASELIEELLRRCGM